MTDRRAMLALSIALVALLMAPSSLAGESADDDLGTTAARPRNGTTAPTARSPVAEPRGDASEGALDREVDPTHPHLAVDAPIATDPPGDWAVLHGGLRPTLGTFGGIATLAVAHARTERFYGAASLSLIRNDAGTHVGAAQLSLGRNLADSFVGVTQLSATENRARTFAGVGQLSLAYNRAGELDGALQASAFNRARSMHGGLQVGAYNRVDERFVGGVQVGAYNHAHGDFIGLAQIGVVSAVGARLLETSDTKSKLTALAQVGLVSSIEGRGAALVQAGMGSVAGELDALAQIGLVTAHATRFRGLVQVAGGALGDVSYGAKIGLLTMASQEHTGLAAGALNSEGSVDGAQVGVVNLSDRVRGVQIGLVNHARSLRGVQIGLANHADDGVLPWTALFNMGFGDSPAADVAEDVARAPSERRAR